MADDNTLTSLAKSCQSVHYEDGVLEVEGPIGQLLASRIGAAAATDKRLREVYLYDIERPAAILEPASHAPLTIARAEDSDLSGLNAWHSNSLRKLYLGGATALTADIMRMFSVCPLDYVDLAHSDVDDDGLVELARCAQSLQDLSIGRTLSRLMSSVRIRSSRN